MFLRILRGALVLASTAVAVPYTLALVSNILYGWPQCRNKYRRAFSPKKVFNYNYALYQMLRDRAKLIFLYLRWKKFYADPEYVLKNIPFGRNQCHLDVYLPKQKLSKSRIPVIIFVYGGSWSSGDKNIYCLLCSELAATTNGIAVCPDYSYYPKGYVDDMVQDVVDCVTWVIENIDQYGGDPSEIILMGHSAGAHLCAMAILEMLHDECTSIQPSFKFQPVDTHLDELKFAESYYGNQYLIAKQQEGLEDSSGSSESFAVVSEHGSSGDSGTNLKLDSCQTSTSLLSSTNSEGFVMPKSELAEEGFGLGDEDQVERKSQATILHVTDQVTQDVSSTPHSRSVGDVEEEQDDDSGDNDSIVTVKPKDIEGHLTLSEISKSVKGFIGLAGVYSISDHFCHEFYRGLEDISRMSRVVYGVDHFDRFSPTQLVKRYGQYLSLPAMVLVHGTGDYIVPISSTSRFSEALSEISANVKVRLVPDCSHYDIVMDLMDTQRTYYSHIMNIVMETVNAIS